MNLPFKVICIDASNLPDILPPHKRVVEGQVYTVIEVATMKLQALLGYKLEEIDASFPYEYFKETRFIPLAGEPVKELEEVLEEELSI